MLIQDLYYHQQQLSQDPRSLAFNLEDQAIYRLQPFDIDEKGSELLAFFLLSDNKEEAVLLFQKDRTNTMITIFPEKLAKIQYRVVGVMTLSLEKVSLSPFPFPKLEKYWKLAKDYSQKYIDDNFYFQVLEPPIPLTTNPNINKLILEQLSISDLYQLTKLSFFIKSMIKKFMYSKLLEEYRLPSSVLHKVNVIKLYYHLQLYDYGEHTILFIVKHGYLPLLKFLFENEIEIRGKIFVFPVTSAINTAALHNQYLMVEYLETLEHRVSVEGANELAARGNLKMLKWLHSRNIHHHPYIKGASEAAINGRLDIIKWIHKTFRILPSIGIFGDAAKNGHLHIFKWMASFGILPNTNPASHSAAEAKQHHILKYMIRKGIEMDTWTLDFSFKANDLDGFNLVAPHVKDLSDYHFFLTRFPSYTPERKVMLKYLSDRITFTAKNISTLSKIPEYADIYADQVTRIPITNNIIVELVEGGHVDLLNRYLINGGTVIAKHFIESLNEAAKLGHLEMLKIFAKVEVFPDEVAIDELIINGKIRVIKWLKSKNVPMKIERFPKVLGKSLLYHLKWINTQLSPLKNFVQKKVSYYDEEDTFVEKYDLEKFQWLTSLEIFPDRRSLYYLCRYVKDEDVDRVNEILAILDYYQSLSSPVIPEMAEFSIVNIMSLRLGQRLLSLKEPIYPKITDIYSNLEDFNSKLSSDRFFKWLVENIQWDKISYHEESYINKVFEIQRLDYFKLIPAKYQLLTKDGLKILLKHRNLNVLEYVYQTQGLVISDGNRGINEINQLMNESLLSSSLDVIQWFLNLKDKLGLTLRWPAELDEESGLTLDVYVYGIEHSFLHVDNNTFLKRYVEKTWDSNLFQFLVERMDRENKRIEFTELFKTAVRHHKSDIIIFIDQWDSRYSYSGLYNKTVRDINDDTHFWESSEELDGYFQFQKMKRDELSSEFFYV